jgi:EAL domain-containing protein (putative c-di-GMP-specific phosphodiesterase class I)/GGDEF domain-containing protein
MGCLSLVELETLEVLQVALGHTIVDELVDRCALALRAHCSGQGWVERIGERSFAYWAPSVPADHAWELGEQLRLLLAEPADAGGVTVLLRAAVGVAAALRVLDADELVQRAGTALLKARSNSATAVYDDSMRQQLLRGVALESLVRDVVAQGRVALAYQPIVRLDDERCIGAEALLRLVDERGRPVAAPEVVDAAERSGRMVELDDLIVREACAAAARWCQAAPDMPVHVAVNLSAHSFDDPSLPQRVEAALQDSDMDPTALCLEITESALMVDPTRAAGALAQLKAQGVRIAVDDFGTGYSSLSYLKAFPVDDLKVDRSFVSGMPEDTEQVAITHAISSMAQALGLAVIAEGVETEDQRKTLLSLGAAFGQGFLWSAAVDAAAITERLVREAASSVGLFERLPPVELAVQSGSAETLVDAVLSIISHEVRTPLSVLKAHAAISACSAGHAPTTPVAERAVARIERFLDLILEASQSSGAITPRRDVIDASGLTSDLLWDRKDIRTTAPMPPLAERQIYADRGLIEQVLDNLVANAAKFGPPGGPIDVTIRPNGYWLDIEVADTGPGVASTDLPSIFRKYGRGNLGGSGLGLGLFLGRRIARAHGGDLLYRHRNPGPGSVFMLRLPRLTA